MHSSPYKQDIINRNNFHHIEWKSKKNAYQVNSTKNDTLHDLYHKEITSTAIIDEISTYDSLKQHYKKKDC